MELSEKTKAWIITVRGLSNQDNLYLSPSHREGHDQVTTLIILMNKALSLEKNEKMRKSILAFITGLPITSQSQLTMHTHSVLIDQLHDGGHNDEIREIANYLKDATQTSFID